MTDPFTRLRRFLRELKRRNVYKVAATYAVVGFLLIQAADLIFPALNIPSWGYSLVVVLILFGFPIALTMAWAFEMSPEGMRRTPEAGEATAEPSSGGVEGWIVVLVILLFAGGGLWYLTAGSGEKPEGEAAGATDTAKTATGRPDTTGPPRIAVLPFENIARDTGDAFFAEGMHEEVLNQLSKVSGLEVISRTSVMQYAETNKTVGEISEELGGVNAVLEGTVRRAGDQVRITTQLIKAPEDEHLWSNTYDRELSPEAIFDIQAEIAERIAGALETRLAGGERDRIEDAPTSDLAAYDAYLQGRSEMFRFMDEWEPGPLDGAVGKLRAAVRRDSTFGEAYAWLAVAYSHRAQLSGATRWLDSASTAVERAQAIDRDLAQAHLAAAYVHLARDSMSARIEALRRVLDLQPSHALAQAELSDALKDQGRYAEAVRAAREAARLDPRQPRVLQEMADQLRAVGLYDEAEAWDRHILEIEPGYLHAFAGLALTYRLRGDPEAALETWQRYEERWQRLSSALFLRFAAQAALAAGQPGQAKGYLGRIPEARRQRFSDESPTRPDRLGMDPAARMALGLAELRLGHREQGRNLLRSAADSLEHQLGEAEGPVAMAPLRAHMQVNLAETFAALGQEEQARRQLEESRAAVERVPHHFLASPFFDDLRSEPRFQEIVRELETKQEAAREEIRRMDIDLYPPEAEPDTAKEKPQSDD